MSEKLDIDRDTQNDCWGPDEDYDGICGNWVVSCLCVAVKEGGYK